MSYKKTVLLTLAVLAVVIASQFLVRRSPMYSYEPYFSLPARPFPTERLLQVTSISAAQTPPSVKSPSIIERNYTKQIDALDQIDNKKISLRFTDADWSAIGGLENGQVLAAFGLEPSKKVFFRLEKYLGPANPKQTREWFDSLK